MDALQSLPVGHAEYIRNFLSLRKAANAAAANPTQTTSSDTITITPEAQKAYETRQYFNTKFAEAGQKVPVPTPLIFRGEYGAFITKEVLLEYHHGNPFISQMQEFAEYTNASLDSIELNKNLIMQTGHKIDESVPEDSALLQKDTNSRQEWLSYSQSNLAKNLERIQSYSEQHGVEEEARAFFNEYLSMMHGKSVDLTSLYREYGSA